MFIYSLKASTIRFFGIVCVALAALIALVAFVPTYVSGNGNADAPAAHLPEETSAPRRTDAGRRGERDLSV